MTPYPDYFYFFLMCSGMLNYPALRWTERTPKDLLGGEGEVERWYVLDVDEDFVEFWRRLEKMR